MQDTFHGTMGESNFNAVTGGSYYLHAFSAAVANPLSSAQQSTLFGCLKSEVCNIGAGKDTVAYLDSYGGVPIREAWRMELLSQLLIYPQVGKFGVRCSAPTPTLLLRVSSKRARR
jgi:hypothetical protein